MAAEVTRRLVGRHLLLLTDFDDTLELELRKGVKFHDGTPLTAAVARMNVGGLAIPADGGKPAIVA